VLTDASGNVAGTATYNPYGKLANSTGIVSPLSYAGQYTDAETGYQYLRARYYDTTTAQFLTRDPLVSLTRTPYAYAANSPSANADPSGLDFWDDTGLSDAWDLVSSHPVETIAAIGVIACAIAEPCGIALEGTIGTWAAAGGADEVLAQVEGDAANCAAA